MEKLLRNLPQVSKLVEEFGDKYPRIYVKKASREVLDRYRKEILEGKRKDLKNLREEVEERIKEISKPSLRKVINATGVVINTNLGRGPINGQALEFVKRIAEGYSNLEFDLESGKRGSRNYHVEGLLCELTGCESAFVVNNNAGAVYLVLNTLCREREVVVSRGELVEIGGSFRVPDIMESSGAILREVGTTNKTRLSDYEEAINERTAMLMKVHRSNFFMEGFTEEVSLEELVGLGKKHGILTYYDAGSGLMLDAQGLGFKVNEPSLKECVSKGLDVVSCSGDKLLSSAQAGIILGKKEIIDAIRKNPMSRAMRIDKLCLGALEFTLRLYLEGRYDEIPVIKLLTQPVEVIRRRAKRLLRLLKDISPVEKSLVKDKSKSGGGSLPELELETYCVALRHSSISCAELSRRLRTSEPPVVGRVKDDLLLIDMRTVFDEEVSVLAEVVKRIVD